MIISTVRYTGRPPIRHGSIWYQWMVHGW